jgi:hypothetical protein
MMFTHEELSDAVRVAGRDGQPFSSAAVRGCLGLTTHDRSQLTRFQNRFRAFQKAAPEQIEKLGSNSYRLKQIDHVRPTELSEASAQPIQTPPLFGSVADEPDCEGSDEPTSFFETPREQDDEREPSQAFGISSLGAVQQAALRTWRERGQWLGQRFAEFFSRV